MGRFAAEQGGASRRDTIEKGPPYAAVAPALLDTHSIRTYYHLVPIYKEKSIHGIVSVRPKDSPSWSNSGRSSWTGTGSAGALILSFCRR